MGLRDIQLPADLNILGEVVVNSFQYPENPAWSVQTDEKEFLVDAIKNFARIWPLVKLAGVFSKPVQDIFRGCIWEEDGRLVGMTIVQRRGSTSGWIVGTVGVLPGYRRRGIARKLVERGLEIIQARGGDKAILTVIDGNTPAYQLYQSLGFEIFSGNIEFQALPGTQPEDPGLPGDYQLVPTSIFDWEPRYDLVKRTTPESHAQYEPVETGRFKQSPIMRLVIPIIMRAQGTAEYWFFVKSRPGGQVVGYGGYSHPRPGKAGFNSIWLRLDPQHQEIANALVQTFFHRVMTLSPGVRTEFSVPIYLDELVTAAEAAGFQRRVTQNRMGITFSEKTPEPG